MEWKIGNITIKNQVVLAPMAGISNSAYRRICKEMGCGLVYAEMVSDKAIMYGTYNVISKKELEERINRIRRKNGEDDVDLRYEWYVDNVPGRSGIAIHSGSNGRTYIRLLVAG